MTKLRARNNNLTRVPPPPLARDTVPGRPAGPTPQTAPPPHGRGPVCTTELGYMARLKPEFDRRGVRIIGLSVDPVDKHEGWAKDIEETQGLAPNFPMIGDPTLTISYPMTTGRNFDEVLRVVDSLQLTARHRVATPVNWRQGDDVIILPSVTSDEARTIYPNGWKEPKPYIRIVPQSAAEGATSLAQI